MVRADDQCMASFYRSDPESSIAALKESFGGGNLKTELKPRNTPNTRKSKIV